jgi:LysM domain
MPLDLEDQLAAYAMWMDERTRPVPERAMARRALPRKRAGHGGRWLATAAALVVVATGATVVVTQRNARERVMTPPGETAMSRASIATVESAASSPSIATISTTSTAVTTTAAAPALGPTEPLPVYVLDSSITGYKVATVEESWIPLDHSLVTIGRPRDGGFDDVMTIAVNAPNSTWALGYIPNSGHRLTTISVPLGRGFVFDEPEDSVTARVKLKITTDRWEVGLFANQRQLDPTGGKGIAPLVEVAKRLQITNDGAAAWPAGLPAGFVELGRRNRREGVNDSRIVTLTGSSNILVSTFRGSLALPRFVLDGRIDSMAIRGHQAWLLPDTHTLRWEERPGMLVVIYGVPRGPEPAQLLSFAEHLRPASAAELGALPHFVPPLPSYVVKAGDYWVGIAEEQGVSLESLLSVNGATVTTALNVGTELKIPR